MVTPPNNINTKIIQTVMTLEECYAKLNGDYSEAKNRLMNDRLIDRFILKFPDDPSMGALRDMVEAGDNVAAFRAVHTLKGVAANLAFTQLFHDASNLTEQLRSLQNAPDPELYRILQQTYDRVIDVLKEYAESK